jgi:hypothetical protein
MLTCPRCGYEAEYVTGEVFVLVWCGFCADLIEVGDLDLHAAGAWSRRERPTIPLAAV